MHFTVVVLFDVLISPSRVLVGPGASTKWGFRPLVLMHECVRQSSAGMGLCECISFAASIPYRRAWYRFSHVLLQFSFEGRPAGSTQKFNFIAIHKRLVV